MKNTFKKFDTFLGITAIGLVSLLAGYLVVDFFTFGYLQDALIDFKDMNSKQKEILYFYLSICIFIGVKMFYYLIKENNKKEVNVED